MTQHQTSVDTVVLIDGLCVTKQGRPVCRVANETIFSGDRVGVLGSNGSGKSTLLRVVAGLEPDFTGTLRVQVPKRQVVFVHQSPILFKGTVLDNVSYGLRARGLPRDRCRGESNDWLKNLGLDGFATRPANELSGGEQRRVAIARACVLRPKLLLLDEPLADLDQEGTQKVQLAVQALTDTTVLIASPVPLPAGLTNRNLQLQSEPHET